MVGVVVGVVCDYICGVVEFVCDEGLLREEGDTNNHCTSIIDSIII